MPEMDVGSQKNANLPQQTHLSAFFPERQLSADGENTRGPGLQHDIIGKNQKESLVSGCRDRDTALSKNSLTCGLSLVLCTQTWDGSDTVVLLLNTPV